MPPGWHFLPGASAATPVQKRNPPSVGENAPDFELNDLSGRSVKLSELAAKSPVVLVVLRGYPGYQCPICTRQVGELITHVQDLNAATAQVVLVYPGSASKLGDRAGEFIKGKSLPASFSFVTDPDYKFTEAYGLRWNAPLETAYPSTFVVDRKGVVRFSKVSKTHGDRAAIADILKSLGAGL